MDLGFEPRQADSEPELFLPDLSVCRHREWVGLLWWVISLYGVACGAVGLHCPPAGRPWSTMDGLWALGQTDSFQALSLSLTSKLLNLFKVHFFLSIITVTY